MLHKFSSLWRKSTSVNPNNENCKHVGSLKCHPSLSPTLQEVSVGGSGDRVKRQMAFQTSMKT